MTVIALTFRWTDGLVGGQTANRHGGRYVALDFCDTDTLATESQSLGKPVGGFFWTENGHCGDLLFKVHSVVLYIQICTMRQGRRFK